MPEQTHCTLGKITHSQSLPDWSLVALVIFLLVSNCFVLTKWMNKKFKWKKQNTFNSVAALWLVMMRLKSQNYKTRPSVTAFYEELVNAAEIILHSFREMEIKTWCPIKYVKEKVTVWVSSHCLVSTSNIWSDHSLNSLEQTNHGE